MKSEDNGLFRVTDDPNQKIPSWGGGEENTKALYKNLHRSVMSMLLGDADKNNDRRLRKDNRVYWYGKQGRTRKVALVGNDGVAYKIKGMYNPTWERYIGFVPERKMTSWDF